MKNDQQIAKQEEGFAGTLKNIQLNDLIQMCCLSVVSLGIRVIKNDRKGIILIKDGQIVHAEVGNEKGEEAFFKILAWESGVFETIEVGHIAQVTIDQNYQYLLMQAAHHADERASQQNDNCIKNQIDLKKIRVLVVDDSPMMSKILSSMINADDRIEVVGTAENGEKALTMLEDLKPDLVTMDVNMPVMDGSTALKHIMIKSPCPVLIMSNVGDGSHKGIIEFLNLGAVDFMSKPVQNKHILIQQQKIVERVLQAAGAQINNFKRVRSSKKQHEVIPYEHERTVCESMLIISAGAGGHSVLLDLVSRLPAELDQCILIFQTIPPALVKTVANYMNERCQLQVEPLENEIQLKSGHCFFSTHGSKFNLKSNGNNTSVIVERSKDDCFDMNVFDQQLSIVAEHFEGKIKTILLSGSEIGTLDGLRGVRQKDGKIIIQKRSTCMVPEPLHRVVKENLFDLELEIEEIAKEISKME